MGFRAHFVLPNAPAIQGPLPAPLIYVGGMYAPSMIVSQYEIKSWDAILVELQSNMQFPDHAYPTVYVGYVLWECGGPVVAEFSKDGVSYGSWLELGLPKKVGHSSGGHSYCYGCSEVFE